MRRPYHYLPSVSTIRAVEKPFIDGTPVDENQTYDPDFVMRQAAHAVAEAAQWMLASPEFGLSTSHSMDHTCGDASSSEETRPHSSAKISASSSSAKTSTSSSSAKTSTRSHAAKYSTTANHRLSAKTAEPDTPVALIVAGPGGNGGDALYAGAELARTGWLTFAIPTVEFTDLYQPALASFEQAGGTLIVVGTTKAVPLGTAATSQPGAIGIRHGNTSGTITPGTPENPTLVRFLEHPALLDRDGRCILLTNPTLVIDGVLGLGGRGPLRSPLAQMIAGLCRNGVGNGREREQFFGGVRASFFDEPHPGFPVLAVDIPSGVDADTGRAHSLSRSVASDSSSHDSLAALEKLPAPLTGHFTANVTVTFGSLRRAHLLSPECGIVLRSDLEARIGTPANRGEPGEVCIDTSAHAGELGEARIGTPAHAGELGEARIGTPADGGECGEARIGTPADGGECGEARIGTPAHVRDARCGEADALLPARMSVEMRARGLEHAIEVESGIVGERDCALTDGTDAVAGASHPKASTTNTLTTALAEIAAHAFITGCRAVNPAEPFTVPLPPGLTPISHGTSPHPGHPLRYHPHPGYLNKYPARCLEPAAISTKYTDGVVGLCVGSTRYPGAALLATSAAVRTTNAMVKYVGACATEVVRALPEVVIAATPADADRVHTWVVGAGMPPSEAADALRSILRLAIRADDTEPGLGSNSTINLAARGADGTQPCFHSGAELDAFSAGVDGTQPDSHPGTEFDGSSADIDGTQPDPHPSDTSSTDSVALDEKTVLARPSDTANPAPALVIDAGAITALAGDAELRRELRSYPGPVIVTPHGGEAKRLLTALGRELNAVADVETLAETPLYGALFLSWQLGVTVLLKGRNTVVAHVERGDEDDGLWSTERESDAAAPGSTDLATAAPGSTDLATSMSSSTGRITSGCHATGSPYIPAARVVAVDTGCSWAATPGSGDALSGILGAIAAGERANSDALWLSPTLYAGAEAARVLAVASELAAHTSEGFATTSASGIIKRIPAARAWVSGDEANPTPGTKPSLPRLHTT